MTTQTETQETPTWRPAIRQSRVRWVASGVIVAVIIGLSIATTQIFAPYLSIALSVWLAGLGLLAVRHILPLASQPAWLRHPVWFSFIAGITASALFVQGALIYGEGQAAAPRASGWMFAAGLALLSALLHVDIRWLMPDDDAPPQSWRAVRFRWIPFGIGAGLVLFTAEINGGIFDLSALSNVSHHVQFALWVLGTGLVGYGLAGHRPHTNLEEHDEHHDTPPDSAWPRWELIALVLILLLAFGLRVYQLQGAQRFLVDEIHFLNPVIHMWLDDNVRIFSPFSSIAAFPYTYPYLQLHTSAFIGNDLDGLRFVSSLFGVLGVWALYLLARALFGVRVALMAALVLAALPIHLQYSRIALNNIADPFFGTLALYLLVLAWRYPHRAVAYFAWAGVSLGLTQYWYEGGRFLFPILVGAWLALMALMALPEKLSQWRQPDLKLYPRAFFAMMVAAVIIGMPIYYTLIGMERPLAQRLETAGVGEQVLDDFSTPEEIALYTARRLNESFLIHVSIPEEALYYGGDDPMIPPLMIPFFVAGVFYALWLSTVNGAFGTPTQRRRLLQAGALLLFMWVGATWFGNVLMSRGRISARYVVEFPALALFIALGLDVLSALIIGWRPRLRGAVLVGVVGVIIGVQIGYFFGPYMTRFNVQSREEQVNRRHDVEDVLYRSVVFEPQTTVHIVDVIPFLVGDLNNYLRFLRAERDQQTIFIQNIPPYGFDYYYLNTLFPDNPHAFFVSPEDTHIIDVLLEVFPEVLGPFQTDHAPAMNTAYVLYYLPANSTFAANVAE